MVFWQDAMGGVLGGIMGRTMGEKLDDSSGGGYRTPGPKVVRIPTHKCSGYFMDDALEESFVVERQGTQRGWLLLLTSLFFVLDILDLALETEYLSTYSLDNPVNVVRKTCTISVCAFLAGIAVWYPGQPQDFEKVVASAMLLWVFSMSWLREEIYRPADSAQDVLYAEMTMVALDTIFVVCLILVIPLRRPALFISTSCAFLLELSAGIFFIVRHELEDQLMMVALYGLLGSGLALFAVTRAFAQEEVSAFFCLTCELLTGRERERTNEKMRRRGKSGKRASGEGYSTRCLHVKIKHQKTRISHLLEEVDDLLKVKSSVSSVERLVELLKGAIEELRWQENLFTSRDTGMDPVTARRVSFANRRLIKELTEAAALASNAEQLFDIDISQLMKRVKNSARRSAAERQRENSHDSAVDGLNPVSVSEGESSPGATAIVGFLNANFVRNSNQMEMVATGRLRPRIFASTSPPVSPSASPLVRSRSIKDRIADETACLLKAFEHLLPKSLGGAPHKEEEKNEREGGAPRAKTDEAEAATKSRNQTQDGPPTGVKVPAEDLNSSAKALKDPYADEWNADLKQLEGASNSSTMRRASTISISPNAKVTVPVEIANALPIIGLHLLCPFLTAPLNLTGITRVLNFLNLVALMCVWLTEHAGVRQFLSPVRNLCVIIAALCHDVGHEGVNNMFHVNKWSELAVTYNDRSVLENFHAAQTFRILQTTGCQLLEKLDTESRRVAGSAIIDLILDTDMKLHFEFLSTMKLRRATTEFASSLSTEGWKAAQSEKKIQEMERDIWMVTRACMKAADLGHSAKPWDVHFARSLCVTEEFFLQGEKEQSLGLPISPLCNRKDSNPVALCKSQIGFLKFVSRELFAELATIEQISAERAVEVRRYHSKAGSIKGAAEKQAAFQRDRQEKHNEEEKGKVELPTRRLKSTQKLGTGMQPPTLSDAFASLSCRSSLLDSRQRSPAVDVPPSRIESVCLFNLDSNVEQWQRPETAGLIPLSLFETTPRQPTSPESAVTLSSPESRSVSPESRRSPFGRSGTALLSFASLKKSPGFLPMTSSNSAKDKFPISEGRTGRAEAEAYAKAEAEEEEEKEAEAEKEEEEEEEEDEEEGEEEEEEEDDDTATGGGRRLERESA
uniref:Phosphodiesterase n=1 Tax=Chromera velia CCMP2878 TaxID=1169474 RepID=A0A0G4FRK5_9ALVE|eukprot:Cvel_18421.t1-p1 / transcript=Cvel_18421.t1 / gene=Cvel_18421 / organism=Chromera_velia_CCMP2878 / gene_product=Calcium/calmodulin-dependent 3',5'-cyclic, putative / transcript_product=Calcium/calmodulin-dependent 3',5'-cyclic, putative / location=Cvel_scaffold1524:27921-41041(-) / protein_length=1137 / sequence_SO=supercontig / SO=protein_coding / is_pseudo=false